MYIIVHTVCTPHVDKYAMLSAVMLSQHIALSLLGVHMGMIPPPLLLRSVGGGVA